MEKKFILLKYFCLLLFSICILQIAILSKVNAQESIKKALNPDGTVKQGIKGSFDAKGFQMVTGKDGKPKFIQKSSKDKRVKPDKNHKSRAEIRKARREQIASDKKQGKDLKVSWQFKFKNSKKQVLKSTGSNNSKNASKREDPRRKFYRERIALKKEQIKNTQMKLQSKSNSYSKQMRNGTGDENWDSRFSIPTGGGDGFNGEVNAIAINGSNIYVGGDFYDEETGEGGIRKWDGSSWTYLGGGTDYIVNAIAVSGNGDVYVGGRFSYAGNMQSNIPANHIAKWNSTTNQWEALIESGEGTANGVDDEVYALAVNGNDLYVGGYFSSAGLSSAKGIAKWDGSNWFSLGMGLNGSYPEVDALVMHNGKLFVGGCFDAVVQSDESSVPNSNSLASWNGSVWDTISLGFGNNISGEVYALASDGTNLYIGGECSFNDGSINCLAKYYYYSGEGNYWAFAPLNGQSEIIDYGIYSLYFSGGSLYVGGYSDNNEEGIFEKFDGTNWTNMGAMPDDEIDAIAVNGSNVYLGGYFGEVANKNDLAYFAKYDGTSWGSLTPTSGGLGCDGNINALAFYNGDLYVGGYFSHVGTVAANSIAKFNGTSWSPLGVGIDGNVYALAVIGSYLYVGGDFYENLDYDISKNITRWDGTNWSSVGGGISGYGNNGLTVYALAANSSDLYVGGSFTLSTVESIAAAQPNPDNVGVINIARYNVSDGSWHSLTKGLDGYSVYSLLIHNSDLYVGGSFSGGVNNPNLHTISGSVKYYLSPYDPIEGVTVNLTGSSTSSTTTGLDGSYTFSNLNAGTYTITPIKSAYTFWPGNQQCTITNDDVTMDPFDGCTGGCSLLSSKTFPMKKGWKVSAKVQSTPIYSPDIIKWDLTNSSWSAVGGGITTDTYDGVYTISGSSNDLYVGGSFSNVGGVPNTDNIVHWNGTNWNSLGGGIDGEVYALSITGSNLYAGGYFSSAGGIPVNNIAYWDGSTWNPLGSGTDEEVDAIAISGTDLYAGGYFTAAGGKPSSGLGIYHHLLSSTPVTAPGIRVNPSSISFGNVKINNYSEGNITIYNTGTADLTISGLTISGGDASSFSIISGGTIPFNISPNASQTITLRFSPLTSGSKSASLQITNNAGSPVSISLSGISGTTITVNKTNIDFGPNGVYTGSKDTSIIITNTSSSDDIIITSVSLTNTDSVFQIIGTPPTKIPPLGSASIRVRFNTTSIGIFTNTLHIINSSVNLPDISVSLSGVVYGSTITSSLTNIDFGSMGYNTGQKDTTIRLQNTGLYNLKISSINFSWQDSVFEILNPISGDGIILPAGGTYDLMVRFKSISNGTRSNVINVVNNSTNNSLIQINLTGKVIGSSIAVTPLTIDFGSNGYLGSPKDTVINLSNTGEQNLNITSAILATIDSCYEILTPIPPGGIIITPKTSFSLQLRFKPNLTGTISNSLTIQNNSTNLPVIKIEMTGSVLNTTISTKQLTLDFGSLGYLSKAKDTTFKIINTGKYNLKITSVSINTPDTLLEILTVIPPEGIIIKPDTGLYYEIKVRLKPNQKGSISNQINIVNNSSNAPTLQIKVQGTVIAPFLTIVPTNLNFGTTTLDSFSITKAVLLKNSGSAPITIKNKIFSGDTASFKVLTSLQSVTLQGGQTDSITIIFYPKTAGNKTGRIDIVSTDITDSQYVILSGTGGGKPVLYVSASNIDFGSTIVGKTKEIGILVKNNGNLTLNISNTTIAGPNKNDYTLTGNITTLERGKSDSMKIKITGNLPAGNKTAQIQISSNDPDKSLSTVVLTTIVRVPVLTRTIDKLLFDTIAMKDTSVKSFTVKNTGDTVLTIKTISVDGPFPGDFIIPGLTFPLDIPVGSEKTISVRFSPLDAGNRYGAVTMNSNDPANPQTTIVVRGQGISNIRPIINLSTNQVEFGIVGVGKTAESTIKIKNTGTDNLLVNNINITGDNNSAFSIQGITLPLQIGINEEKTITIKFTPPTSGIETASIVIKSNDPLKPEISAGLKGEGQALLKPNITISTDQIDLGENGMYETSTSTFKIQNTGGEVLTVSAIEVGGNNPADFGISGGTYPQNISVNGEIVITVTFTPANTGDRNAQIRITSNDPAKGVMIVNLTGKGKGSTVTANPTFIDFGSIGYQSEAKESPVNITNTGNYKLKIFSASLSTPEPCFGITTSIGSDGVIIDPGQQYSIGVRFTPSSVGTKQSTILISNNSTNTGVASVSLVGTVLQPNIRTQDSIPIPKDSSNTIDTSKPSTTIPVVITNGTTLNKKVSIPQSIITIYDKYITGDTVSFHIRNKKVPITLGPGQSDTTDIEFRPRSAGLKTAILHIISNDITPHRQINLSGEGNGKAIISTIDKIDFGEIKYGKTKDSVIYVRNKGNFDLNISSRNIVGNNKDNFELRTTNLPKLLQTNEIDSITIRINAGTTYGTKTAQVQIINNDPVNSDYRITLSGNTIMPVITRSIDKLLFDTVGIGYIRDTVFTIGNDGNDILTVNNINIDGAYASEFTIPEQTFPITINSKGQIKIRVRFSPTGIGNRYASLTINNNDPVNPAITITVSGNGKVIDIPKMTIAIKSIDFGTLEILSTKDTTITIKNEGTAKLQIDSLYLSGNDKVSYQISGMTLPLQLDPSTAKDIKITYSPKASNASSTAAIRIAGNDPFNPVTEILLSGKSVSNPNIVVTIDQINFGVLGITGQKDTTITIKSTGTAKLNIDSLYITGTDRDYYKVINPTSPVSIDPSGSQNITIRFAPKVGNYLPTAKLRIVSNSTKNSIIEIQLLGSISRPVIFVDNTKIDYGRVMILNPKDINVTVMNKGNQELSIDSIKIGGNNPKEFTLIKDNPVIPFKLGSNEVKTIPIRFIADTTGIKTATVEISSNDPLFIRTNIEITGSVLAPKIAMDIQGINFSNVTVNTNRDTLIKIRNTGDTNLVIQSIRFTDGDTTDYNILDNLNGKTIQPNTETNFRVRFTPSQTGVRQANMEIKTNDVSNASIKLAITGTGIQPKLKVLNAQINMGRLFVIKSKDTSSTITNAGTDILYLKRISITGTDSTRYKITNISVQLPANIKPDETINYTVQFNPGEKGIKGAQIAIESNDPTSGIYKIPVSGEGIIPKIVIDNEMTGNLNTEKQISFHLTESYIPDIIRVYYRKGGAINYDSSIVTFTSAFASTYASTYTFKPELLTTDGLDYYIKMYWGSYSLSSPDSDYSNHPVSIQVKVDKIANTFSTIGKKYSVVTMPVIFNGTTLLNEMIRNLGPLNNSIWRIFKWRNDTYEEYINDNDWQIKPGDGFWMVSKDNVTIDIQNCMTIPTNTPYKIRLQPGWNQIGSPFLFSVPASSIIIPKDKKVETTLLEWLVDDQNYSVVDMSGVINEWEGYYIKNNETDSVDIYIVPQKYQTGLSKKSNNIVTSEQSAGWRLKIGLNCGGKKNNIGEIGILADSRDEWDQNDVSEPPVINTENISISFPHNNDWKECKGKYVRDYKSMNKEGQSWEMEIKNNAKTTSSINGIEMKFNKTGDFPKEYQIYIYDYTNQKGIKYDWVSYNFVCKEGETKKYKIVVGTADYIEKLRKEDETLKERITNYTLFQNYPNPFNPNTKIEYMIPENVRVVLTIYNALGQRVETIINKEQNKGRYEIDWNPKNLPSGIYFYRLQAGSYFESKKMLYVR